MIEIPNPDTSVSRRSAALLTGTSRGIGNAAAPQLAQSGYDLFLLTRKEQEKLEGCVALYRTAGMRVATRLADVNDSVACAEVSTDFDRHFSVSSLLVASAGIFHLDLLQDMTFGDWDHMVHTDSGSCPCLLKLAIPRMLHAGNGKPIFLSSIWGSRGASCEVAYSAAKGGVNSFIRVLVKELVPSSIQTNAITLDAIDTDMNACLDTEGRHIPEDEILTGRFGTAEEVAVLVCQSVAAPAYFGGNILTLSGGWVL